MAMKPAISYGIRNQYGTYDIVEITSKDKYYYYGRNLNGMQTRGRLYDLRGELSTKDDALNAQTGIRNAIMETEHFFRAARELENKARCERDRAIAKAIARNKKA
jgi:hypothetical protein